MAGRGRIPMHQELHGFRGGLPPPPRRGHVPVAINPLEEEIVIRHGEIRRLHADNHLLVEENVALRREVVAIKEELHASGQLITRIRADKEAQVREFIQKAQKLEADARGLESAGAELLQLKSEAQKLDDLRHELSSDVHDMTKELKRLKSKNQQIPKLRSEIDGLHQELLRARAAHEYEKKANADQIEQQQVLDKNLTSMAREVEKLRAEQMSLEKRSRGSGPVVYGDPYVGEIGHYGSSPWSTYDHGGLPRH